MTGLAALALVTSLLPRPGLTVEQEIRRAFPEDPARAVRIGWCESKHRWSTAKNGQHLGEFQIATKVHSGLLRSMGYRAEDMFQLGPNLAVARRLKNAGPKRDPWKAWDSSRRRGCWS